MEGTKPIWVATMDVAFGAWSLYATFMTCASFGFPLAPLPDNAKRDRLLADLQHGLRDEHPDRCDVAMSALAGEFGNQELVYSCLMQSAVEACEIFGPELTYRMIENIGSAAPQSRIHRSTHGMLLALSDYCDYTEAARSTAFQSLSRIMSRAGISGSVMNRAKEVIDYKVTHHDARRSITPAEFLKFYLQDGAQAFKP